MQFKLDLFLSRSGMIVCPRIRELTASQLLRYSRMKIPIPTIQTISVASSLHNVSFMTKCISQTYQSPSSNWEPPGSCSMFVKMYNIATKPQSRDYGLVARLSIPTLFVRNFFTPSCIDSISLGLLEDE